MQSPFKPNSCGYKDQRASLVNVSLNQDLKQVSQPLKTSKGPVDQSLPSMVPSQIPLTQPRSKNEGTLVEFICLKLSDFGVKYDRQ